MESEGPYKSERWECQNEFVITGPGWEFVGGTYTKNEADLASRFANLAYAEGRKSMERELEELFNTARSLCIERNNLFGWENDEVLDFVAYKKMRGIE